ncbi:MAG: hypothetical protein ACR2GP_14695 [Burkholderiaceae bacterium]
MDHVATGKRPLYKSLYLQVILNRETEAEADEPEQVLAATIEACRVTQYAPATAVATSLLR